MDSFDDRLHLPRADLVQSRVISGQVTHHQTDNGHPDTAHVPDNVAPARQELVRGIFNVIGKHRKMRDSGESLDRLPAVIEFMIADGSRIEAEHIRKLVEGSAAVEASRPECLAPYRPRLEECRRTAFTLPPNFRRKISEAAETFRIGKQLGVQIVRVQDTQGADIILGANDLRAAMEDSQKAARK